jgi:RHS repeat-associated protein
VDYTTNRIVGVNYDANGNQTGLGINFDAENRVTYVDGVNYAYDAQNRRIFSWPGTTDYSGQGNPDIYQVVLYSPSGQKLGTYQIDVEAIGPAGTALSSIVSTLKTSDQYLGGRRLAAIDQLGSAGTYYLWGEAKGSTNPQDTWSYATYWTDSFTSLNYANNRYYSNAYGRFMTPDPAGRRAARRADPQSWNRYAYTRGDPVNRRDQSGLDDDGCVQNADGTYDCGLIVIDNVDDSADGEDTGWDDGSDNNNDPLPDGVPHPDLPIQGQDKSGTAGAAKINAIINPLSPRP